MPRRIHSVNRIIPAVRIHIEPDEVAISIDIPIRIQEPSPLRVIVPALQIVQPRVRIVVIPPIPERIERADNPLLNRCRARLGGNRAVAPCVIGIRAYLGSVFRVDGDNVPLQVLLEVVGVEYIFGITLVSVLQPDGSAVLIIEVYKEVVRGLRATTVLRRPCLGDDLGAVQRVVVRRTSICLTGSDALIVIGKAIPELPGVHVHYHELAAVPLQRIPVVGGGVADGVILIYRRTDLRQPVAGIIVRLGRGFVTRCARRIRICFLTKPIACVVVGVHVGLVQVRVILPRQLAQRIVGVPGHKAVLVGAFGDVPVGIIGVRVPGGAVPRLRLVDLHLPGGAPGADVSICTKGLAIF